MGISAAVLARLTRVKTLPVVLAPIGMGAALAAERTGRFSWGWLLVSLVGGAGLFLGAMALNDYYDERSGADGLGRLERASVITGSGFIASKTLTPSGVLGVAASAWGVALVLGVVAVGRAPIVLGLGAAGALLAHQYVAPPLRYGYRGLGPIGVAIAFGFLPVAGSYALQAERIDAAAWWAGLVPALLGALVYFHADLLHWRGDRTAKKMTPAARYGIETSLIASGIGIIAAYVTLTVQVALALYPMWALSGLLTAPVLASAWGMAARDPIPQPVLRLLGATLGAAVGVALAVSLALWLG